MPSKKSNNQGKFHLLSIALIPINKKLEFVRNLVCGGLVILCFIAISYFLLFRNSI
jgi:hypothetical protein